MVLKASAAVVVALVMTTVAGCDDGGKTGTPTTRSLPLHRPGSSAASTPTVPIPTEKQLRQALIQPPAGAVGVTRASGRADTLLARIGARRASNVVTQSPDCLAPGSGYRQALGSTPAAYLSYGGVGAYSTVLLFATSEAKARQAVTRGVPEECRSVKASAGGTTMTATVVSDDPLDLGEGGRIAKIDEVTGGVRLHVWDARSSAPVTSGPARSAVRTPPGRTRCGWPGRSTAR